MPQHMDFQQVDQRQILHLMAEARYFPEEAEILALRSGRQHLQLGYQ